MSITIEYKRWIEIYNDNSKETLVKILKLNALPKNRLPEKYLEQRYNIWFNTICKSICKNYENCSDNWWDELLIENGVYNINEFNEKLRFIRKAGKKLKKNK